MATALVVLIFAVLLGYYLYNLREAVPSFAEKLNKTYDYIIVGGGTAGCVLASRLSEDPTASVLLIEAGGYDLGNPIVDTPGYVDSTSMSELDWGYRTVPQKNSHQAMKEQRSYWPRGRTLGGTGNLNYMVYMRGSRHDYDGWASQGADGWSYDEVFPYFLKSEDIQVESLKKSEYHSEGGLLKVSEYYSTPLTDIFLKAGQHLGYKIRDCNGNADDMEGVYYIQSTIGNGVRWSTARGFLKPVLERTNLHVSLHSHVTKVLTEKKKAVGVEFIRNGKKEKIKVKKEVILSAGTVGSTQILMLSGIGPRDHLRQMKIPVVADLPVGNNLQDHMYYLMQVDIDKPYSVTPDKALSLKTWIEYQLFGSGYMSGAGLLEGHAYFKTNPKDPSPDVQLFLLSTQPRFWDKHSFNMQLQDEVRKETLPKISDSDRPGEGFIMDVVAPEHPRSVGTIRLASSDPFDYPIIDPNYLEHPDDVATMIRGIRKAQDFLNTPHFKSIGATIYSSKKPFSRCKKHKYDTDAYWECEIRQISSCVFHQVGTCKMAAANDSSAVVDSKLRVRGVAGLRVADASVMPFVPAANTNAPTIMIAEKASDMIKGIDSVKQFRKKTRKRS